MAALNGPDDDQHGSAREPATVVREFAAAELFDRTFDEGMQLVEAAAHYLDGEGRQDSKLLSRDAALAYAGESMRVTTRLMQVASWLLVQRAVRQGDMKTEDARQPRYRIGEPTPPAPLGASEIGSLPEPLKDLGRRSEALFDRVANLDRRMYPEGQAEAKADAPHPVLSQLDRLRAEFEG